MIRLDIGKIPVTALEPGATETIDECVHIQRCCLLRFSSDRDRVYRPIQSVIGKTRFELGKSSVHHLVHRGWHGNTILCEYVASVIETGGECEVRESIQMTTV